MVNNGVNPVSCATFCIANFSVLINVAITAGTFWPLKGKQNNSTTLTCYHLIKLLFHVCKKISIHQGSCLFVRFGLHQFLRKISGSFAAKFSTHKLAAKFVCLLCCARQVAYSGFIRAFSLKTSASCGWK